MHKALELLKKIKNDKNYCDNCNGLDYCNNFNCNKLCELNLCANESIAELEEAMKPKTCDGCKLENRFGATCCECSRHCKDYYEPKDNA